MVVCSVLMTVKLFKLTQGGGILRRPNRVETYERRGEWQPLGLETWCWMASLELGPV